jgi:hypothetical protein
VPGPSPEQVLDAIERALEEGRLWAFASWRASLAWRVRRLAPAFAWWMQDRTERR